MEPRLVSQAGHGCRDDSIGTSPFLLLFLSLLRDEVLLRRGGGGPKKVLMRARAALTSAVDLRRVKGVVGSSIHASLPLKPEGRFSGILSPLGGASKLLPLCSRLLLAGGLYMETSKGGLSLEAARASASAAAAS